MQYLCEFVGEVDRRQIPGDVNILFETKFVKPKRLLLIHYANIDAMEIYLLPRLLQIVYCRFPFRIGKEIIVEYLYPFAVRV